MFNKRPDRRELNPRELNPSDAERLAAAALSKLPLAKAPDAIWTSIEASLEAPRVPESRPAFTWIRAGWAMGTAGAVAALVIAAISYWHAEHGLRWEVAHTSGAESRNATIGVGEWLQTDSSSRAEIRVGSIGTVEVAPDTRLRILATRPNEQRLSLEHGEIDATISAPPKIFFVETRSATAVDLGCAYKMKVDAAGNGMLNVTLGWVSFEWEHRESMVPAGASCRTHAHAGPGTPFFDDAPETLKTALDAFDFSGGSESSLHIILATARPRDTLTLWHLLSRVEPSLRPLVYDRMVALAPPPNSVTREKVLALDPSALKMWKDELAWTW